MDGVRDKAEASTDSTGMMEEPFGNSGIKDPLMGQTRTSPTFSTSSVSTSLANLRFSSPFKRRPKPKEANASSSGLSKEEMFKLYLIKLEEEANYFQVSASPEDEMCDCLKCQVSKSTSSLNMYIFASP